MKIIRINCVYAVGMHHYGSRSLTVDASYLARLDINNSHDPNAIAITIHGKTAGYLRRQDAKIVAQIVKAGFVYHDSVGLRLKPKFEPVTKNRKLGPEQRCDLEFNCQDSNVSDVMELLRKSHLHAFFV